MKEYYSIEEMDGYYRIGSLENVYCYLVVGEQEAMLIDTSNGFGDLNETVRSITSKPLHIINTHGHGDHCGGNAQFEEKVWIHSKDMELCKEHTRNLRRKDGALRAMNSINYETGMKYNGLPAGFDLNQYISYGTGNLTVAYEGKLFNLGGKTLEIVETPGHTKGGISVLYKEKKLLFMGDATGPFVWLFLEEATSRKEYIKTLEKMYNLPVGSYIGGHNPQIMTREDILLYKRVAIEGKYGDGQPFQSFLEMDNLRVCSLDNMTMDDMFKPGFAAIVIGPEE